MVYLKHYNDHATDDNYEVDYKYQYLLTFGEKHGAIRDRKKAADLLVSTPCHYVPNAGEAHTPMSRVGPVHAISTHTVGCYLLITITNYYYYYSL